MWLWSNARNKYDYKLNITRITSWMLQGPLLPKKPKAYTSMIKVVYINKFVAGYENLF